MIEHVARAFGVAYSKAGMIKLLHRLGFEWRKPKGLPARADVAAQEAFVAAYEKLLNGLAPDEIVYFADAVHPEYQSRPAHGWVRRGERLAVGAGKGRQRVNLAGALCLETGDCRIVEDVRITAETTVELLARLERANPGKRLIHVILDNAATNRGRRCGNGWRGRTAASGRSSCPPTPPTSTPSSACGRSCTATSPTTATTPTSAPSPRRSCASSSPPCQQVGHHPRHRHRQLPHHRSREISGRRVDGV